MRQIIHFDNMGSIGSYEAELSSGIVNIPQYAWTHASNVRFLGNRIEPMHKDNVFFTSSSYSTSFTFRPEGVVNVIGEPQTAATGNKNYFVYKDSIKLFGSYADTLDQWEFSAIYLPSSAGEALLDLQVTQFGPIAIFSGRGIPLQWGDTASAINLSKPVKFLENWSSTASVTCRFVRSFKNYLVAGSIVKAGEKYSNMIQWSHPATFGTVPSSWDYGDPTKDAGQVQIGENNEDIIDALVLGESLIIYKQNSVWGMEFIGAPNIFKFYKIFDDRGVLDVDCISVLPDGRHAVFGEYDIYYHDGRTFNSIFPEQFRKKIFNAIRKRDEAGGNIRKRYSINYEKENEIWFCYIGIADTDYIYPTHAAIWNYEHNTFYTRVLYDYVAPLGVFHGISKISSARLYTKLSGISGGIDQYYPIFNNFRTFGSTDDGIGILEIETSTTYQAGYVIKNNLPLGRQMQDGSIKQNQRSIKSIYSIYPHIEMSSDVSVTMQVSLMVGNSINEGMSTSTYNFITSQEKIDVRKAGRIFGIKFKWPESASKIALSGFSLDVDIEGDR